MKYNSIDTKGFMLDASANLKAAAQLADNATFIGYDKDKLESALSAIMASYRLMRLAQELHAEAVSFEKEMSEKAKEAETKDSKTENELPY